MKSYLIALFLAAMLSYETFAFVPQPTPSVTGSTGLIRMPSADVIPYKNLNVGLDFGPIAFEDRWQLLYKMNIGTFQGMELGCVGSDDQKGGIKEGVFINMKYGLSADNSPYPLLLAIGVENLTSRTLSDVYMVATRYFPNGSKFHFGFVGDFIATDEASSKFRPVGAFAYDFPAFGEKTYCLVEIFAGEHVFQIDTGLKWYISDTFALNLNGINIFAAKNTPEENYRDSKVIMMGFSWINPL